MNIGTKSAKPRRLVWRGSIGAHVFRLISDGSDAWLEILIATDALGAETWMPARIDEEHGLEIIARLGCQIHKRQRPQSSSIVNIGAQRLG